MLFYIPFVFADLLVTNWQTPYKETISDYGSQKCLVKKVCLILDLYWSVPRCVLVLNIRKYLLIVKTYNTWRDLHMSICKFPSVIWITSPSEIQNT